ncbi:hypothetical protein [Rhodococcus olei]|uniref:hypothetical protein n=1 Tax=Rhodococcus olei TaxID=2161675 RepID=UPI0031E5FE26
MPSHATQGGVVPSAPEMDARLQEDRRTPAGRERTSRAEAGALPDGVFARLDGDVGLWQDGRRLLWSMNGYGAPLEVAAEVEVEVLTPRAAMNVMAAGYEPVVHPSAQGAN